MMVIEETQIPDAALPVDALKRHLRLGTGFTDADLQDEVLASFLRAAIAAIEARTEKALLTRGFTLELSDWKDPEGQVLPRAPVAQVTAVVLTDRVGGQTAVDANMYRLQRDAIAPVLRPNGAWLPAVPQGGFVTLSFDAGYAAAFDHIPADLAQAVLLLAAHYYEYRDETSLGEGCMPFGVTSLLSRYRKLRMGLNA